MKRILRFVLLKIAHVLMPYLKADSISRALTLSNSFASCGENCSIGELAEITGPRYIHIGDNFHAGRFLRMDAIDYYNGVVYRPKVRIGNNVIIEDSCHIGCVDQIEIGDGTVIASRVFITDHLHGRVDKSDIGAPPIERDLTFKRVTIGDNVWIGEGVSILPGIELGSNVIVGANAVVTHSFGPNLVVAGCPARVIKSLE